MACYAGHNSQCLMSALLQMFPLPEATDLPDGL